ncbi:MAG: hypothetical protein KPEEDBHJ_02166 [Anaerolineales bacterium]|nr:hypothetical protein [Anaerolineales bacterium]
MTTFRKFAVIYLIASLLSACGGSPPEETLSEEEIVLTFSVGTMVANLFETQTALVTPTPASTNTPLPTNTFLPTPTAFNTALPLATWTPAPIFYSPTPNLALIPTVTGTPPTATSNAGALAFGCNNAVFVRDANYPPGTTVSAGEGFVKTWKVENNGSCEWAYNYTLVVVADEYFDSSWGRLGRNVAVGTWAEVSVIVNAPKHAGTYTGYWRMADAGGNAFGATLALTIVVP